MIARFGVVFLLVASVAHASGYRSASQSGGTRVAIDPGTTVRLTSDIDANNSTTETLDAAGVYTGTARDIKDYAGAIVTVYSDQASAVDGLSIQWSPDGTNWDGSDDFTIPAATQKTFSFQPVSKYMRIRYTNGGTTQTVFRLQTQLKATNFKPSSHRITDSISTDDDGTLVVAVIQAEKDGNGFDHVRSTASGNLKVANVEDGLSIAKGDVTGHSLVHKFGNAYDFDQADTEVTVWDGADDGTAWENMRYDYSTTAAIDSISSSSTNDTLAILVQGLDANTNLVTQTVTLNGQTRVALSTNLWRVFRAYNDNGTLAVGHVVIYENTALTAGVPTDKSKIRAIIHPEAQQTEMAIYTVPAGKTAYLRQGYAGTAGASKTSNYIVRFYARQPGGVFRLQNRASLSDTGTSFFVRPYVDPPGFPAGTDLEVTVEMTASGGTAAAIAAGFDLVLVDD